MSVWKRLVEALSRRRAEPAPIRNYFTITIGSMRDAETGEPIAGPVVIDWPFWQTLAVGPQGDRFPALPVLGFQGLNVNAVVDGYEQNTMASWRPVSEPVDTVIDFVLRKTAKPKAPADAGERGRLRVDGKVFRREDGSIFPWRGCSDFALFARFCRGEDIAPILEERIAIGFNLLRVFGMFDGFGIGGPQASGLGMFTPGNTPGYYGKLRAFVELLQERGLRCEFVYFADADQRSDGTGGLMTQRVDRQAHIDAVRDALLGTWGVCHEIANEAFKNFEDAESYTIDPKLGPRAYGTKLPDGPIPEVWKILDYLTPHDHERKDEWPRTARGYGEIVDAFKVPVVADEPIGYAEVARPGSRATDPNDAAYFAATMQMFASGSTFHSDDGVASRLFRPVQKAAAEAWAFGARWVPPAATLAPYQRGGAGGGAGVGDMPLEHRDLGEGVEPMALRTFAKRVGEVEYVVAVRPSPGWTAIPRDGWKVIEQPRRGFVKLAR